MRSLRCRLMRHSWIGRRRLAGPTILRSRRRLLTTERHLTRHGGSATGRCKTMSRSCWRPIGRLARRKGLVSGRMGVLSARGRDVGRPWHNVRRAVTTTTARGYSDRLWGWGCCGGDQSWYPNPQGNIAKCDQVAILNIGSINGPIVEIGVIHRTQILQDQLVSLPGQFALLS